MANIEHAISLPFTLGFTGSIETTTDQKKIWADRVLSVIGTAVGERVQRYYFGSKIHFDTFENVASAESQLYRDISESFSTYLPLLSFNNFQTSYKQDTGVLNVTVFYSLPDGTQDTTQIGTVQISGNQPPKEI
jgi:phage baseplate assembly protein W